MSWRCLFRPPRLYACLAGFCSAAGSSCFCLTPPWRKKIISKCTGPIVIKFSGLVDIWVQMSDLIITSPLGGV